MDIVLLILAVVIIILAVSGAGLNKKMNKIHSKFCFVFFILAVVASIYYLGYAGEQGSLGVVFVVAPSFALACLVLTIVLWVLQLISKSTSK